MKKLALFSASLLALLLASPAYAERVLKIRSEGNMLGPSVAYLSEIGILVQCKLGKALWQAKNPTLVTLINDEYKTFLTVPINEYINELRSDSDSPLLTNLQVQPELFLKTFKARRAEAFSKPGGAKNDLVSRIVAIDSPIKNKEVNRIWCQYLGLSKVNLGLPVLLEQKANSGASDLALSFVNGNKLKTNKSKELTSTIDHSRSTHKQKWVEEFKTREISFAEIDKKSFEIKSSWHRAKDRPSLYLSQEGDIKQSDIDDLFFRPLK